MERVGAAAEAVFFVLVLVLGAVLVLITAVGFLGAASFLYLFQGVAIPHRVCRGLALPAVVDARGVQQAARVEPFGLRSILPWRAVIATEGLRVALLVIGVGDEFGVSAVCAALAVA
jgi:hypothetical protein